MVDCLEREHVSMLFTIGGDGTLRGAKAICDEISRRKLPISVIGVPKTIDNDIPVMERTFGFHTAVSRAVQAINSAHCEAFAHRRGLALVKVRKGGKRKSSQYG
jgi:6-phosphofructokinase 1